MFFANMRCIIDKMKQKIIFFGSGDYTVPVVKMLTNFDLALVVTTEQSGPIARFAKQNNIPLLVSDLTAETDIRTIKDIKPTLGVLVSFGAIIPSSVIDTFPNGILNIHPSPLPRYKGPSPIQETILADEKITGVSIITLDDQIDHGPIVDFTSVNLTGKETTQDLKNSLFLLGSKMIKVIIHNLEQDREIKAAAQDHSKESFTEKISRDNGRLDLNNPPPKETILRMIRAYYPWPGVFTEAKLNNVSKRIKLLPDQKIQVEGKNIMNYKDFVNGYQKEGEKILKKLDLV